MDFACSCIGILNRASSKRQASGAAGLRLPYTVEDCPTCRHCVKAARENSVSS